MGPSKICFLCQRKSSENRGLHRIPKNPKTRPAWLVFCKLDETVDDVSNVRICSAHFSPDDYIEPRAKEMGNKMILKQDTIPSILKLHGLSVSKRMYIEIRLQSEPKLSRLANWHMEKLNVESIQVAGCSTQNEVETSKRLRLSKPRYVGDIKSPHLATPRWARGSFNLAKN